MRSALSVSFVAFMCAVLGAQARQQPQGAGAPTAVGGRGGRGAQPGLEPRIVSFEAKPGTVRAGQPVLLVWHTENPSGVAIEPGVGAVTPRGTRQVAPST